MKATALKAKIYLTDAKMDVEVIGFVDRDSYVQVDCVKEIADDFEPFGNWLDYERFSKDDLAACEEALLVEATARTHLEDEYLRDRMESIAEDRYLEQVKGV